MRENYLALHLGCICLSALTVLRPSPSLASADLLEGIPPASWSPELLQGQDKPLPRVALQQQQPILYTQEELEQLVLVLEAIQKLGIRPRQEREIEFLIRDLERLQVQGGAEIELSPEQNELLASLFESLTPEEIASIDEELGDRQVEVAILTRSELQEALSLLRGIQEQRLRRREFREIQALIIELEKLEAQEEPEVILSNEQAKFIFDLRDSLTPEERERLGFEIGSIEIPSRLSQQDLQDLLLVLQEMQKLGLGREQDRQIASLIGDVEQLQARGADEVELTEEQRDTIGNLIGSLTPEQFNRLSDALPKTTEARVLTEAEWDNLIRVFRGASEIDIEPQRAREIAEWLEFLESRKVEGRTQYLLTGEQIDAIEGILDSFTRAQIRQIARALGSFGASPSVTVLTPIGFGGYWRTGSAGIVFVHRTRFTQGADASLAASLGLGNPEKAVGLDASVAITGLSNEAGEEDNFGGGSLSFQVSRTLPNNFGIGVGLQNIVRWNSGASDNGASTYVVVSKIQALKQDLSEPLSLAYISLGLGNGIYRSEDDFEPDEDLGGTPFNVFGSVAINLSDNINGIVEWTGQDLSLGMSIVPFREVPLVFTPSLVDVTGSAGDGVRFNGNLVYSIVF